IGDGFRDFLASGWSELRRVPQGTFYYFYLLPFRYMQDPYALWHTVSLATEVGLALLLYKLVRNLCEDAWLAGFVACTMIAVPLDHVVPYVTSANYRLGTLAALASLYLTDTAAREGRWGWRLPAALLLAVIGEWVFTEAALGYEPARLLIVWNRFYRPGRPMREYIAPLAKWLALFALLGIGLVVYKLTFKPYGIYAGMYATGLSRLLDREALAGTERLFSLGLWRLLRHEQSFGHPESAVLGVLAGALTFCILLAFRRSPAAKGAVPAPRSSRLFLFLLGVVMLLPVLFLFHYAGRPPRLGTDSNHATIMQPGYALLLGAGVHWIALRAASAARVAFLALALALGWFAGSGVYYSNLNLDFFAVASARQQEFLGAFKKRFPSPPQHADFVIDAVPPRYSPRLETFFQFEDIHASYELELGLNRLYAPGALHGERRYRAYPIEEMTADYRAKGPAMFRSTFMRDSHYGKDALDFSQMTYVYWRGGRVLVNREILQENPRALYRELADKPPPSWAAPAE